MNNIIETIIGATVGTAAGLLFGYWLNILIDTAKTHRICRRLLKSIEKNQPIKAHNLIEANGERIAHAIDMIWSHNFMSNALYTLDLHYGDIILTDRRGEKHLITCHKVSDTERNKEVLDGFVEYLKRYMRRFSPKSRKA